MPRTKKIINKSGLSETSNLSYEQYLKSGFSLLTDRLSLRVYKLAPKAEYGIFQRGLDLRVQFYLDKKRIYEFVVDKAFFYQSNRNKEDRKWMRSFADIHLNKVKDAVIKKEKSSVK
tara:strand:+ start:39 stop:389 length:351 start_codon:yes stop_codon:yes gene_type:complete